MTTAERTATDALRGGTGTLRPVAVLATPPDETRAARLDRTGQADPDLPAADPDELPPGAVSPDVS